MAQKLKQESGLIYPENYGFYAPLAYGEHLVVNTKDISILNWNDHYKAILNVLKDGIYSDEVHKIMITVVFADSIALDLSLIHI